jgi:hypothetical protein
LIFEPNLPPAPIPMIQNSMNQQVTVHEGFSSLYPFRCTQESGHLEKHRWVQRHEGEGGRFSGSVGKAPT